jgi:hypothetical protein
MATFSTSTTAERLLDFYRRLGPMTDPGRYASLFDPLPHDVGELARIVQGLAIHEFARYQDDERLRVPETVYNALLNRSEDIITTTKAPLTRRTP